MNIKDTIPALFALQVKKRPDDVAISYAGESITYLQLDERSNQLAHYLLEKGVHPDTRIALCMERSFELLIVIMGILKAGCAYVPLDNSHPHERLMYILEDNNFPILIIQSKIKEKFTAYPGELVELDTDINIANLSTHAPKIQLESHHLAYVIYTSGTTGKPKGVLIEQSSVVNYINWFVDYSKCKRKQRIDFSSNIIFDMAVTASLLPLLVGLEIVICNDDVKKSASGYLYYLNSNKINWIKITPSYFKVLLHAVNTKKYPLPHLKGIVLGGENLTIADCSSWLNLYPKHDLFNEYGPTEATVAVSHYKVTPANLWQLDTNVPIGVPGLNMNCIILDENNNPVAKGDIGELHIGGAGLARGYLNQAKITSQKFITVNSDRLYKTGDLAKYLSDGNIAYLGRIDFQVKIRGYRIELGEIEKVLLTHPAIIEATLLVRDDKLVAYFISNDTQLNSEIIKKHLQKSLPEYMIPSTYVSLDAFPLTANGKLDQRALPDPELKRNNYQAPKSHLEMVLAEIWSDALQVKNIGLNDNFFELGGHSLSAARIISFINNKLGKDIALADIYQATSIAQLAVVVEKANYIQSNEIISESSPLLIPLSDFQFLQWIADTFEPKAKRLNIAIRKRFQGQLDKLALQRAFDAVFKKHEVLFYKTLRFRPIQEIIPEQPFSWSEHTLHNDNYEEKLKQAFHDLIHNYHWQNHSPLILANLFCLKDNIFELQISMPHIISDGQCGEILMQELSEFYLSFQNKQQPVIETDHQFRTYIQKEQGYLESYLDKDINFWEHYLQDASLFTFSQYSIESNKTNDFNYSTYVEIPRSALQNLCQYCSSNHLSVQDGLSAAITTALLPYADNPNNLKTIFLNIVKSTRDDPSYDNALGCFLRLEPIKINLRKELDFDSLSKKIQQEVLYTSTYQRCSSLVKLACTRTFNKPGKAVKHYLINLFASLYTTLFDLPIFTKKIISLTGRMSVPKLHNQYLININVQSNFFTEHTSLLPIFGLEPKNISLHEYDLLKIDNVLDLYFFRDESQNKSYIIISANLKPQVRESLAKDIVNVLTTQMVSQVVKEAL